MKNIFEEAYALQNFLVGKKYKFCFIGGLALQRWGELRTTNDIDLTLLTGFSGEEEYIDSLVAEYEPRMNNFRELALTARVLLLKSQGGVGIDIAFGGMPFEESTIKRSSESEYLPGIKLITCSAEDLVVHKAFAARPKDWIDLEGILIRQTNLDWHYIDQQLLPLAELKEEPEIVSRLNTLRQSTSAKMT